MEFDSDGVSLHYELHGPEDGPPVVLVHGFASDYQLNWVGTRWQETLLKAGYRVIGLDCRGHGASDKPHDPGAYSPAVMAADFRRLLDEVHIAAARYIGYSMGARVGLQAMIDFPDRIVRAVLGGLGIGGAVEEAEKIARALRGGEPESPSALSFQRFASARSTNDLEALAACMEGLGHSAGFDPARLAAITTPILLAVGERDDIAHDAAQLAARIPAARLVVILGRDHMGAVPARQFKDAAVEFLAGT
ncbi:MAG: alpha/beta fold hydrolase [Chloroflexi bacterium]|nr:MAG: alpha/beta fold hydrolase [Chloroflexota bacterium]